MAIIEICHVNKSYGTRPVLTDFNITAETGQIIGLLGPNGCGKSTLLKIMAGVISDYRGDVRIGGHKPGLQTKSLVSYLPERSYLSGWMRPVDTFDFFRRLLCRFRRVKAEDMLRRFRLDARQPIKTMSKGLQEKTAAGPGHGPPGQSVSARRTDGRR
jgi:ABC-2 type transport system ATP-binding protein